MGDSADFLIRPATREDVPALLGLIRELAEYEHLEDEVTATEIGLEQALFGSASSPPSAWVLLGCLGATPIAYAVYFYTFSTFLGRHGIYLEDLYVQPAHRRQGYGRRLLLELAARAGREDCGRLEWTVLDWNRTAIRFYESLGAEILPDWRVCRVAGDALKRLANRGT